MQTKLLREIKNALPDLRKSEVKVAEFVLNKPDDIIELTTAQASSAIGVSEPTLIRFCQAIGFNGFQKFKLTLAQQLAADNYFNSYEIDPNDSIQEVTEKVFDSTISEILNVRSQLDQGIVEEAIETLANAKRVEFYAFGGSVPIAMDAQHKFFRLKISFGVIVIGLMPSGTPLSRICDIALDIDVGENARLTRPLTSRLAYMAIIDVLAVGVAQLKPEAQDHLFNIVTSQNSLKLK